MSGILKAQLLNLEKQAETLEKIVHKELIELQFVKDKEVRRYEQSILRKLHKLDALQDQLDAVTAKLKEAAEWEPVSYADAKYEYKRPKYVKPEKPKKEPRKPRKVYPVQSPRQATPKKRVPDRDRKPKVVKPPKVKPEPKPKVVRAPKPKPAPKPRKPAEPQEVMLAKKRRTKATANLKGLDNQMAAEKETLLRRLEERKARVADLAVRNTGKWWNQDKRGARLALENVERQLAGLDERRMEREQALKAQIDKVTEEINNLLENDSQLV